MVTRTSLTEEELKELIKYLLLAIGIESVKSLRSREEVIIFASILKSLNRGLES